MTEQHLSDHRRVGGRRGRALDDLISAFDRSDVARFGWTAAIGSAVHGATSGHTYADVFGKGERPANAVVTQTIRAEEFFDLLLERLARYGAQLHESGLQSASALPSAR